MTEYSSMSHEQLYNYVFSGSPSTVDAEATFNQKHGKSVSEATSDLQTTLAKIQASWSGAAADEFSQQANSIVQQMQQHAQIADNTYTWMDYASRSLTWAQQNMPSPPSGAEQDLADVNKNSISEWGLGLLTDGGSYLASKAAEEDISKKKAAAVSVMTQLASAYTTANSHLQSQNIDGGTDPGDPGGSSTKKNGQDGSGSSAGGGSGGGMIMPMAMAVPSGGGAGGGSGSAPHAFTSPAQPVTTGSTGTGTGSGSGTTGSGTTSSKQPTTVTAGLGDLPTGTTASIPSSGYSGAGSTTGGYSANNSLGGLGPGGLADFGGSGAAGLGSGGLGADDEGSFGSGGGLGTGSGTGSGLSGGTGTGELGEEAGGTGFGAQPGTGSTTAAAAAGDAEGAGSTGQNAMMGGGMGGMGRGAGGQEERGTRASWLKEDPDYWYGDKMKNAAPPGGVIE